MEKYVKKWGMLRKVCSFCSFFQATVLPATLPTNVFVAIPPTNQVRDGVPKMKLVHASVLQTGGMSSQQKHSRGAGQVAQDCLGHSRRRV